MFDIAPTELLLCAVVALLVIGPKDLPRALRVVGHWVGRARGVARQFRGGIDTMMREAELQEMEQRWKAENERIMREYPPVAAPESIAGDGANADPTGDAERADREPDVPRAKAEHVDHSNPRRMVSIPPPLQPDPSIDVATGPALPQQ